MLVSGTFSGPGTSSIFLPVPNAEFAVQLSGTYAGATLYLTMASATSVAYPGAAQQEPILSEIIAWEAGQIATPSAGSFALMFGPDGKTPISLHYPGAVIVNPPFTSAATAAAIAAGGTSLFVYQLVCVSLGSGTVDYQFSQ